MNEKELNNNLAKIKALVMDVDGTLTDAAMFYSRNGEELKRFSTRDGMGIKLLRNGGIKTAIATSENSEISRQRGIKLKIDEIVLGTRDKSTTVKELAEKFSLELEQIAYIGDDVNDASVMKIVGVSACPSDSSETILKIADYVCSNKGGCGAVREFAEKILISQNKSIVLSENW